MIDLRSDLLVRASEKMRDAAAAAALGPLYFGLREDPWQQKLEASVAALLGMEDALIFPTCTMANTTAMILLGGARGSIVLTQPGAHVLVSEGGAGAALAGLMLQAVGDAIAAAMPTLQAWRDNMAPGDVQRSSPHLCVVENTHNRAGGVALAPAYIDDVVALARGHGLALHCDGSRLLYAAQALAVEPARLVAGFDSVSISLNKTLGAPVGAVLAGSAQLIARALVLRQQLGGGMRPVAGICAASLAGMHELESLRHVMPLARQLAQGLTGCEGLVVQSPAGITNLVIVGLRPDKDTDDFLRRMEGNGLLALKLGPHRVRFAVYRGITEPQIQQAIRIARDAIDGPLNHPETTQ